MAARRYHLQGQKIPEGYQLFEDRLEVAGISFRKSDAAAFAESTNGWLELERECESKHDKNAIKIFGCSEGFFWTNRRFVGYVPRNIAKLIIEGGFWDKIKPRLLKTYVGDRGFVEILFQILGPKGQKFQFKPPKSQEGGHCSDYVERVEQLKAEKRINEAIELLLKLVAQTEKEAQVNVGGVAPWYYEQLALIYRKGKKYADEVQILERYDSQPKAPGVTPAKLAGRLVVARKLREKHRA